MVNVNEAAFTFYCKKIEKFIAGELDNPLISTTKTTAILLERKFKDKHIKLVKYCTVSEKHGIYQYKIT